MKLINAELKKKQLKLKDLPAELQQRIADFQQMVLSFNDWYDNWEYGDKDEQEKKVLDEKENEIAEEEVALATEIRMLGQEPQPQPTPEPQPAPEPKKEESGGIGWLVFGAVVLVGTLGLVNVLKKK